MAMTARRNNATDPPKEFAAILSTAGLRPVKVVADGVLRRCGTVDHPRSKNGWHVLYADPPAGVFGNWATGISKKWQLRGESLSDGDRQRLRKVIEKQRAERERNQAELRKKAIEAARQYLASLGPATDNNAYLKHKGVKAVGGLLADGDLLIVPIMGAEGNPISYQRITPDGGKKFAPDCPTAGGWFALRGDGGPLAICEGVATGLSIFEATGRTVLVSFSAGNLGAVARMARDRYQDRQIVVCADNDAETAERIGKNPGVDAAKTAAQAVGGLLAIPPADGDWNDVHQAHGIEAVRASIEAAEGQQTSKAKGGKSNGVDLVCAADIKPKAVNWIWNGWIAEGKIHILAGVAGQGKSTLLFALAAIISIGGRWPDGTHAPIGEVVIWSGEDDPADTIIPRLIACGAELNRIHLVEGVIVDGKKRSFDPSTDILILRDSMKDRNVKLLVIDPIVSAVSGDSHKNAEVRRSLQPLVDLAAETGCAVYGITHFTKNTAGREPVERVTSSLAFGALTRVVTVAAKLPDDGRQSKGARLFARAKSNIGPDGGGFHYFIEFGPIPGHPGIYNTFITWGDKVDGTARELLARAEAPEADDQKSREAESWLRDALQEGPLSAGEIQSAAQKAGITKSTLWRAKDRLGVKSTKTGFSKGRAWAWELPEESTVGAIQPVVDSTRQKDTQHTDIEVESTYNPRREFYGALDSTDPMNSTDCEPRRIQSVNSTDGASNGAVFSAFDARRIHEPACRDSTHEDEIFDEDRVIL